MIREICGLMGGVGYKDTLSIPHFLPIFLLSFVEDFKFTRHCNILFGVGGCGSVVQSSPSVLHQTRYCLKIYPRYI